MFHNVQKFHHRLAHDRPLTYFLGFRNFSKNDCRFGLQHQLFVAVFQSIMAAKSCLLLKKMEETRQEKVAGNPSLSKATNCVEIRSFGAPRESHHSF